MQVGTETRIQGVRTVPVDLHWDERGFFGEALNMKTLAEAGIAFPVYQANLSMSARKWSVRGMHWQADPAGQAKIVFCIRGSAWDVAVDVREDSPTYGEHIGLKLWSSPREKSGVRGIYIPRGCAHGWQALEDNTALLYFVDAPWSLAHERGLRPNDPELAIPWPFPVSGLSPRDASWPLFTPPLREKRTGL